MIIHDVAQGTSAWTALRCGKPTASCFDSIMTPGKKKSEGQDKYIQHLLAERVLGKPIEGFKSRYMELGNEYESRAVAAYELANICETYKVGFVTSDDGLFGCSPDRFIVGQDDGAVEAKSPSPAVHVSYLLAATGASKEYKVQLQAQIWLCERDWVDIVSYCPGFKDAAIYRAYRDDEFITELAAHVRAFSDRLESLSATFRDRGWIKGTEPAPAEDHSSDFITDEDVAWAHARFEIGGDMYQGQA